MGAITGLHAVLVILLFLACRANGAGAASLQTQTFNLHPGWNAIYLEVQPEANTPAEVFASVALESVWMLKVPTLGVEFIEDPSEPVFSNAQWLRYIPADKPESFQTTLFRIHAHRAYLVKVTAAAPVTLRVTGKPVVQALTWKPDGFVLRGFPVDPGAAPSFGTFFRGSRAHYDPVVRRLQPIYRLNTTGDWVLLDPDDKIGPGEAYWVYTKGSSQYAGPFEVRLPFGDTFDFGREVQRQDLTLSDLSGAGLTVTLRDVVAPSASILSYLNPDIGKGIEYLALPAAYQVSLASGETLDVAIAVRRQEMAGETFETVLEASDGAGMRVLIPVTAERFLTPSERSLQGATGGSGVVRRSAGLRALTPAQEAKTHAGLWSGTITINAVSEARSLTSDEPKPVAREFNLRLLLHVDTNGVTRLLREVIQMVQEGSYTNDPVTGLRARATPDRAVLVTDFSKIGQFKGVALRDGVSQGRRLSSVGFDFAAGNTNNFVLLTGFFAVGQKVSGALNIPPAHPTNPFLHRYHPDHDNLAADFKQFKQEAYPITRTVEFEFSPPPKDSKSVAYGYNEISGVYRETLGGLHRRPIKVSGTFQLNRLSVTGVLNE